MKNVAASQQDALRTGVGWRSGVINLSWRLTVETDKGHLDIKFRYDSENKALTAVVEPIDPELVSEAVYEVMHWCETFLHSKVKNTGEVKVD